MKDQLSIRNPKFPPPSEPAPFFVMLDDFVPLLKASISAEPNSSSFLVSPPKGAACQEHEASLHGDQLPARPDSRPLCPWVSEPSTCLPVSVDDDFAGAADAQRQEAGVRAEHDARAPGRSSPPGQREGVCVRPALLNGAACVRAEWQVSHFSKKIVAGAGKPLVSPPFVAAGLLDLRLLIFPCPQQDSRGRHNKSQLAKRVACGPLTCALKLKVPVGDAPVLTFYLSLGSCPPQGPYTCDFGQHPVAGCDDLTVDWPDHADSGGGLRASLDIVDLRPSSGEGLASSI
mmetsp:Transcript_30264/g.85348  ORF Transcript_30264/g.85348 Transcript_30264/m.85348 type:complete len:288 (-) Transcript_30264:184-1047(-)|eukprot:CAMPEP_0179348454 /NCGR_PEP_ID=MMETSP0797-20121207/73705_1 /TAXON_ID=47934 /ORGANISM="Dinophysis acuminata, Strain DAEP01" /LENGTH=287 /DNA_ID=CAMNT_0021063249 /DNA_START=62 /DNA_END=925 /DNA_ORIENTATION=+